VIDLRRARQPDQTGRIAGPDGVRIAFEVPAIGADRCPLVVIEGADHMIPRRHPVKANLLIRDFVNSISGRGS
jgi:hypothetical protein